MPTDSPSEGFTPPNTALNKLYNDLSTIDYGLLCVDLYLLESVPLKPKEIETEQVSPFDTVGEPGSEEDWKAFGDRLNGPEPPKIILRETGWIEDWDNASWVLYPKTDFGRLPWGDVFDNKWIGEENRYKKIDGALSDLSALPTEAAVQFNLNRFIELAQRLSESSTTWWATVAREKKFREEPLWWSLRRFEQFHRFIDPLFHTINIPPIDGDHKLYFGRAFLERYEMLVLKKVECISAIVTKTRQLNPPPIPSGKQTNPNSKRPRARPFVDFTDKLTNGFTQIDLDGLLCHVGMKNTAGQTLGFTKYLMHHVIDALILEEYFEDGNRELDQKALSRYLGIEETRVARGYGSKKTVKTKAETYLKNLKTNAKNNR